MIGLLLIAVTVILYWPVLRHQFINYDDTDYVLRNALVQRGLTWEGLAWAFGRLHGTATYWHPLTWLSHMLDCQFFGLQPGPHHMVSVLLHSFNALLLFVVLRRMTGALWSSAMVAALFAWHPLQVGTVAWVAERKNLLGAFFWLCTMLAYLRYVERPGLRRYAWMALAFLAGLMSKAPLLLTLPFALLLLDFWPLRRLRLAASNQPATAPSIEWGQIQQPKGEAAPSEDRLAGGRWGPNRSLGDLIVEKLPLFLFSIAGLWITLLAHHGIGMGRAGTALGFGPRLANAVVSYARYLGKTVWPSDLSIVYLHPGSWPAWQVAGAAVLLAVLTIGALSAWRRAPYLGTGWFWFLVVLVPFSGLIQLGIQAMADRFAYVPLIGLFMALTWAVTNGARCWPRPTVFLGGVGGLALLACLVTTPRELRHWESSITIFSRALVLDSKNFIAHNNLALGLALEARWDEALGHAREALRYNPNSAQSHNLAGMILSSQQKPAEAIPHYESAARLDPAWALPRIGLGQALARSNRVEEAIEQYNLALAIAPRDAQAHSELAQLLVSRRRTAEAIGHYRAALAVTPDSALDLNNLAWLLATEPQAELRNGSEAVRLAERACQLTRRQVAVFIGTLAAAYAEAGRFAEAAQAAEEARAAAVAAGQTELAARNEQLLKLYQAQRPYRETTRGSP